VLQAVFGHPFGKLNMISRLNFLRFNCMLTEPGQGQHIFNRQKGLDLCGRMDEIPKQIVLFLVYGGFNDFSIGGHTQPRVH
jgi:hypothetical protein